MDLGLLFTVPVTVNQEEIFFQLGDNPPIFTGLNRLVQVFIITLLTDAQTDSMDPGLGAGLLSLLGSPINQIDTTGSETQINIIFAEAQRQVLAEQDSLELEASERLRTASILSVEVNQARQEIQIEFLIENAQGERAFVRL